MVTVLSFDHMTGENREFDEISILLSTFDNSHSSRDNKNARSNWCVESCSSLSGSGLEMGLK